MSLHSRFQPRSNAEVDELLKKEQAKAESDSEYESESGSESESKSEEEEEEKEEEQKKSSELSDMLSGVQLDKEAKDDKEVKKEEAKKEEPKKEAKEEPKKEEPKKEVKEEPKKEVKEESKEEEEEEEEEEADEDESNLIKNEYEVTVKLSDLQADPNSPLYSVKSFEELGLSDELLKGLFAMKFNKPSKIQETALPLLIRNPPKNVIGQSQSGTGKTAAFTLGMLTRIDIDNPAPQALCLSPARELARQTMDVVVEMAKYTKITTALAVPEAIPRGATVVGQLVVGTPGTVLDLIRKRKLDVSNIKVLVIDEADNMLDSQGMGDQCNKVKHALPKSIQYVLFSATFDDSVYKYALKFVPNANEIRLKHNELNVKEIQQFYIDVDGPENKMELFLDLYGMLTTGSSIIFVATKRTANILYSSLTKEGHKCSVLHSELVASERDRLIDEFRNNMSKVLITTNVLSRGIDIPAVTMVVNYDLPFTRDQRPDASTFLHRIGRTGRFGRKGLAISFVDNQKSYKALEYFRKYFENMTMTRIDSTDPEEIEKIIKKAMKEFTSS